MPIALHGAPRGILPAKKTRLPPSYSSNNNSSQVNFFDILPEEIILQILRHVNCSHKEFQKLRLVCKHWANLIRDRSLQDKYSSLTDTVFVYMLSNELSSN
jgi:hypothetical protein